MVQQCLHGVSLDLNKNEPTMTLAVSSTPLTKSESRSFLSGSNSASQSPLADDSLRTPAPSSNLVSSESTIATKASFMKVSQVTPFEGDYGLYSLTGCTNGASENDNALTTKTNSHPVSRRGGRFVSPSARNSSSPSGKTIDDGNHMAETCSDGTDEGKDDHSSKGAVLEFKTFRSTPSHVGVDSIDDTNDDTSMLLMKINDTKDRVPSLCSSAGSTNRDVLNSDEIKTENEENEDSSKDVAKISSAHERAIQTVVKLEREEETIIREPPKIVSTSLCHNVSDASSEKELKVPAGSHDKDLDAAEENVQTATSTRESETKQQESIHNLKGSEGEANTSIPCRSPPRNSFPTFDDVRSPGSAIFWLSPGPPTPKSPSKVGSNGMENYMATPTDFLIKGHDHESQHKQSATKSIHDKYPDIDTSNALAWLQSPTGLFSPGGFAPSLDNTPIRKTPRTPLVSTSFFFSDVASLPMKAGHNRNNGSGEAERHHSSTATAITSETYADSRNNSMNGASNHGTPNNTNVVCVSPMIVTSKAETQSTQSPNNLAAYDCRMDDTNSLTNTPAAFTGSTPVMDLKNVFASPQERSAFKILRSLPLLLNDDDDRVRLQLDDSDDEDDDDYAADDATLKNKRNRSHHHLPHRMLPKRSISQSDNLEGIDSVHRHIAQRELMDDEDLGLLLQLASNKNSNTPQSSQASSVVFRSSPLHYQTSDNHMASPEGEASKSSRLQILIAATTTMSQRRLSSNSTSSSSKLRHPNIDFDPPPIAGIRSNSSSGSKELYVGGSLASNSSSTPNGGASTDQYAEYPGMPPYPLPYAHYPPLPPHSHHHMVKGYPPYPPSHYPTPPPPPSQSSSGQVSTKGRVSSKASTKQNKTVAATTKVVKTPFNKKEAKASSNKRATPPRTEEKPVSSGKKRKMNYVLASPTSPALSKNGITTGINDSTSGHPSTAKKGKNKSPPSASRSQKAAAGIAAAKATQGGNGDAAALAAAILRGVTMRPSGKWQAQLYFAGKSRYIGVFDNREKAALAYEIAREKLKHGELSIGQDKTSTENLVNAARKAAFEGVSQSEA